MTGTPAQTERSHVMHHTSPSAAKPSIVRPRLRIQEPETGLWKDKDLDRETELHSEEPSLWLHNAICFCAPGMKYNQPACNRRGGVFTKGGGRQGIKPATSTMQHTRASRGVFQSGKVRPLRRARWAAWRVQWRGHQCQCWRA